MIYEVFPFSDVPKGSRIAIYGGGKVGLCVFEQLRVTKYCEVVFIADKNHDTSTLLKGRDVEVVSPNELADSGNYDYVVICTTDIDYQAQMASRLDELRVPSEKRLVVPAANCLRLPFSSFSQHGEDMIILNALKHMGYFKDQLLPSYIDIGAHHPYNISNTALFYQMGCRGINIEANPALIKEFEKERPEDTNLCLGVGAENGTFPFYISDVSGLNTFKKDNLSFNESLYKTDTGIEKEYAVRETIDLPVRKLQDIIDEYCGGKWPDLMSIDIEGLEYETLKVCDLSQGPALIAVEVNFDGDLFIEMFREKGYFPYLWYRENILFVKNEYEDKVHAHNARA
jgi:FkbM family methyltransferase